MKATNQINYMPNDYACVCKHKHTNHRIESRYKSCQGKFTQNKFTLTNVRNLLQQTYSKYFRLLKPKRKTTLGKLN